MKSAAICFPSFLTVDVQKSFGSGANIEACFGLDLASFGITVLFGPSGCGKTTLLRMISGLERPDSGSLRLEEEVWFEKNQVQAPEKRRVGHVFQEAALFPHLSVASNIAYGLKDRKGREARVQELIQRVGLSGLEDRRPSQLSGGQRQRVALARALAPRPRLLLLDEPFASLDRAAAESLRHELRTMLRAEGIPAILVTHDRGDALSLGDRMLRMEEGRILEDGRPEEILTGQSMDLESGISESVVRAQVVGRREGLLCLQAGDALLYAPDPGGHFEQARLCIRSEGVTLERSLKGSPRNHLLGVIRDLEPMGPLTRVRLDCTFHLEALITTWTCRDLDLRIGEPVQALVKATAIRVLPLEEAARLSPMPLRAAI